MDENTYKSTASDQNSNSESAIFLIINKRLDELLFEFTKYLHNFDYKQKDIIYKKIQLEKALMIVEMQEIWFKNFSWFLAKIYMYSIIVMATLFLLFGNINFELLVGGIIGSAIYYVIIQIVSPKRLMKDKISLKNSISILENELIKMSK